MGKVRALAIIFAVVAGLFVLGAILVVVLSQEGREERVLDGEVRRVEVLSERGAVIIQPGPSGQARIEERNTWVVGAPRVAARLSERTLRVDVTCPSWSIVSCSSDVTLTVPADVVVDAKTVRGRLEVRGTDGSLDAVSEDGDVVVQSPTRTLVARSVTGSVSAELSSQPLRVEMRSETGDVRLTLPAGDYALQANSGVGGEQVRGLTAVPGAPREVKVSSGSGDVVVSATP